MRAPSLPDKMPAPIAEPEVANRFAVLYDRLVRPFL